jgi:hypothetical protein
MAKVKLPKARFDLGDWIAQPVSGGRRIGQVTEYDTWMGRLPVSYGVFVYTEDTEPEFRIWSEPDLEPATPQEIAVNSARAAVQKPPLIFRDPQGPRR